MKHKIIYPLILLLYIASGCSTTYNVTYADYDRSVDFALYKTFSWIPNQDNDSTAYHNQIIFNNTINYFSHELAARGLMMDNDNPDLLLSLKVTESKKNKTETTGSNFPSYNYNNFYRYRAMSPHNPYFNLNPRSYYYHGPFNYGGYTYAYTTRTVEYTHGAITLNIMDRRHKKFIYTATVEADLYDPSVLQKELHPAVHGLLENYPVKVPAKKLK